MGDVDYEVQRADREGAKQIYHRNLLIKEVEDMSLVLIDQEKDELGPEVPK